MMQLEVLQPIQEAHDNLIELPRVVHITLQLNSVVIIPLVCVMLKVWMKYKFGKWNVVEFTKSAPEPLTNQLLLLTHLLPVIAA